MKIRDCSLKIKCSTCGRFIPLVDLESGLARASLISVDSDYSTEEIEYRCKTCREKEEA